MIQQYNRVEFKDRLTEFPLRRLLTRNDDGTTDIVRSQGEVFEEGTPINARNLNNMDEGIFINRQAIIDLIDRVSYLEIQASINDSLIGVPSDNIIKQYFTSIGWCQINRGIYNTSYNCLMLNEYIEGGED